MQNFLVFVFILYTGIAGMMTLQVVRPPLMKWYNSQGWLIRGTGPVDILLKQVGYRLSFEVFIFDLACAFGSVGGWYLVMRKNKAAV